MLRFAQPAALGLLLLLPVLVVFFVWRWRLQKARIQRLGEADLIAGLMPNLSSQRQVWKAGLWLIALFFLIIALARPVWGVELNVIEAQGVSVLVVLDVSNSMEAQDVLPSRIERARLTIRDLFTGLNGHEVGLLLFAGEPVLQFPLTTDLFSAGVFLESAGTHSISQQGTALADALLLALESFDPQSPAAKVIVLFTDGENHEGDVVRAAQVAAEQSVIIHVVGYGDPEGAPIPIYDPFGQQTGYVTNRANEIVISRLDETVLSAIAEATGGLYQRVSANNIESVNILQAVSRLETQLLERRTEQQGVERFAIFVGLAVLMLSLEMMLPEARRGEL
jgi:Ca-activated chloride channel family protein